MISDCKPILLVVLLALAALPQGTASGLRQLDDIDIQLKFCMLLVKVDGIDGIKGGWEITGFKQIGDDEECLEDSIQINVNDGKLKIPDKHNGGQITTIGDYAFHASTDAHHSAHSIDQSTRAHSAR